MGINEKVYWIALNSGTAGAYGNPLIKSNAVPVRINEEIVEWFLQFWRDRRFRWIRIISG